MPYLPSDAAKKSEIYNNILNGSEIEYQKEIDFLKEQQQISGSLDANTPLRDDDGFLVSFESKEAGVALEEEFEEVRLENAQYFFEGELDDDFKYYFQPEEDDEEDEDEQGDEVSDEEIEFQLTKRDNLIQVMNYYFGEENGPDISTKKLHSKINEFFKVEGKKGGKNAEGWEEFRQDKIKVEKFRKKGKKKRIGGSGRPRANYRDLKRDLDGYHYDDVINKQLYHTNEGQRIWLQLGFPYQKDEK
jgi:hypothetical protein|tara:strand:+ start:56 stop:793 length:738 start_codon:yes stop_codon:yes gene_type:complete